MPEVVSVAVKVRLCTSGHSSLGIIVNFVPVCVISKPSPGDIEI
jgi:hypothetical protein